MVKLGDRTRGRGVAFSISAIALAVGLAACGSGSSTSVSKSSTVQSGTKASVPAVGGTLTYANTAGPISMNPAIMGNGRLGIFGEPAYDSLITIQPDGKLTPDLATSWGFVAGSNNTVFDITLRNGVKFSNGTTMTAQDVVNTIQYYQKTARFSIVMGKIASVTATGPNAVKITLAQPNPDLAYAFDQVLQMGDIIAPAGLANPQGMSNATFGTGPYVLDSSQTIPGTTYTYLPNKYYWNPSAIHWKKIVIKVFTDSNSALQALESGQVQVMLGDPTLATTAISAGGVNVLASPVQWSGMIIADHGGQVVPALANPKVRQALNYAVNRAAITKALYGSYGSPTDQLQGIGLSGYSQSFQNYYSYNPTKAKALLSQAGYPHGFSMTLVEQGTSQTNLMAEAFAGQMAQIGVNVTIKNDASFGQYVTDFTSKKFPILAQELNYGSPFFISLELFSPMLWNPFNVVSARDNALLQQALLASPSQASSRWKALFTGVMKNGYWIPISNSDVVYFTSKSVTAVAPGETLNINPVTVTPAQ